MAATKRAAKVTTKASPVDEGVDEAMAWETTPAPATAAVPAKVPAKTKTAAVTTMRVLDTIPDNAPREHKSVYVGIIRDFLALGTESPVEIRRFITPTGAKLAKDGLHKLDLSSLGDIPEFKVIERRVKLEDGARGSVLYFQRA